MEAYPLFPLSTAPFVPGTQALYTHADGDCLRFDTYFGALSGMALRRYTALREAGLVIRTSGDGEAALCRRTRSGMEETLQSVPVTGGTEACFPFNVESDALYYLRLEGCGLMSGRFVTGQAPSLPKVAIVVCTFRREAEVIRSLTALAGEINRRAELREVFHIFCVDNGRTLTGAQLAGCGECVTLLQNRNLGGSGGYTRGLMEALNADEGYTHAWLMDDDIAADPAVLWRVRMALAYLAPEHSGLQLAAGMLPFDRPCLQYEATARYDGRTFHSNRAGLNLAEPEKLLENEKEASADYAAWWSLVLPLRAVREKGLPMPFFIKIDDVEYGLRTGAETAALNGLGVWHPSFSEKTNAYLEYYVTRNSLITLALHPKLGAAASSVLSGRLLKAVAYGEPAYMAAAARGAEDYLKGAAFLLAADGEALNDAIRAEYSKPGVPFAGRKDMLFAALRHALTPSALKCLRLYLPMLRRLKKESPAVAEEYARRRGELCAEKGWRERLGLW